MSEYRHATGYLELINGSYLRRITPSRDVTPDGPDRRVTYRDAERIEAWWHADVHPQEIFRELDETLEYDGNRVPTNTDFRPQPGGWYLRLERWREMPFVRAVVEVPPGFGVVFGRGIEHRRYGRDGLLIDAFDLAEGATVIRRMWFSGRSIVSTRSLTRAEAVTLAREAGLDLAAAGLGG